MLHSSEDLASYYAALKLPRVMVRDFSLLYDSWIQHNGIEWAVKRCKTLYTDYIRFRAGQPLVGTWYKRNKTGLPSGVVSSIFKLSSTSPKKSFACGTLLRVYTRHISPKETEEQLGKFLDGVCAEDVVIPKDIETGVVDAGVSYLGRVFVDIQQPSYMSYIASPGKRVPLSNGKTAPEETHWSTQWETLANTKTGRILTEKYPRIFEGVFAGFIRHQRGDYQFIPKGIDAVGKIGLIQEPGLKLRAVANPNRVYQVALRPLGDAVYGMLKNIPWDCTFNQERAAPVVQKHLLANKSCHCIDLSGATDYFPLSLQIKLLKAVFINMDDYINLFDDLSRSNWVFHDTVIKWTKGQPLGLFPSFASFALTHGMLLYSLNANSHNDQFFILGDDVVILDDVLAFKYKAALIEIGCPISESKTITSSVLAEFGGKIISKDTIEPQLKWRLLSDDNFVDVVRLLGLGALRLLRPKQRKVVKAIWDIPDFVGGLGFNPDGIPLEVRYEKYLTLFGDDSGTYLMSYDRRFNQFFNSAETTSDCTYSQRWDMTQLPDLDQRSASLVLKYLPLMSKWYGIMGTNLFEVSRKGVLPLEGNVGRRSTLLDKLLSKLHM